ncbi:MAG: hypothetical protein GY715_22255 [Planctomycetes bacterium]|nr:hypothetical protein [Planctomycetota bacterium]
MAPTSDQPTYGAPAPAVHRLLLQRDGHRWQFQFTSDDAGALNRRIAELAVDPDATLDHHDARMLERRIARMRPEPSSPDSSVPTT